MIDDNSMGYTKEEYYQVSEKQGLPKRCPILGNCRRSVETRYEMGMKLGGSDISFDEFIHSYGQKWDPDSMIKSIEKVSWSFVYDVLTSVDNACPEVTLFEPNYLPHVFRQSAFCNAVWYKDTRRFEAEKKHYSDCAEFSEYIFHQFGEKKIKGITQSLSRDQLPERVLEDYLVNNIEALEHGLKFIERQKSIGKWTADIFASDSMGNDVIIELKSKNLHRNDVLMLTGQVSKYFNRLKKTANDLRLIIVVPRSNKDNLNEIYHGLQHWIENNKVSLYQFDYMLYDKKFVFAKVSFD